MKVLLVGESNPHSDEALTLTPRGAAGDRLRRALGMTDEEYLRRFKRINLCRRTWDAAEADQVAANLYFEYRAGIGSGRMILLGARVARAFDLPYDVFKNVLPGVVVFPHPSGRCRSWNDPLTVLQAREVVRGMIS